MPLPFRSESPATFLVQQKVSAGLRDSSGTKTLKRFVVGRLMNLERVSRKQKTQTYIITRDQAAENIAKRKATRHGLDRSQTLDKRHAEPKQLFVFFLYERRGLPERQRPPTRGFVRRIKEERDCMRPFVSLRY